MLAVTLIQLFAVGAAAASPRCVIVHDAANAQDLKLEAYGANAVRHSQPCNRTTKHGAITS